MRTAQAHDPSPIVGSIQLPPLTSVGLGSTCSKIRIATVRVESLRFGENQNAQLVRRSYLSICSTAGKRIEADSHKPQWTTLVSPSISESSGCCC
jgi:hypothetical protein